MPSYGPGKVLGWWKECDFIVQTDDFVVVRPRSIAVPFELLGPGYHHPEICGFGQFSKLGGFGRRKDLGLESGKLEVPGSLPGDGSVKRSDEFCVVMQFLLHAFVLAAHRTMHNVSPGIARDFARCAHCDRAVNDRQRRLESVDIPDRFAHEIVNVERVADMHHVSVLDWLRGMPNVDPDDMIMLGQNGQEGFAHLSEANHQNDFTVAV